MHVRGTIEGDGVFATAPNPHNTLGRCREELRERHMATTRGDARQLFCYRKPHRLLQRAQQAPNQRRPRQQQVQELAGWVELQRYGPTVAHNLCGGVLLDHLIQHLHLQDAAESPALVQYSAHYPTLLCLLSALRVDPAGGEPTPDPHVEALPPYGAALMFEVHREHAAGAHRWVQLHYQAGPDAPVVVLPLPGGADNLTHPDLPGAVTSEQFSRWAGPRRFDSSEVRRSLGCGLCQALCVSNLHVRSQLHALFSSSPFLSHSLCKCVKSRIELLRQCHSAVGRYHPGKLLRPKPKP